MGSRSANADLDSVVASSDNMAADCAPDAAGAEDSVPGDVAVVRFDDLPVAQQTDPPP